MRLPRFVGVPQCVAVHHALTAGHLRPTAWYPVLEADVLPVGLSTLPLSHPVRMRHLRNDDVTPPRVAKVSAGKWWGARTFCCDSDECNSAHISRPMTIVAVITALLTAAAAR
ncbi:unnamed protein product [Chrysodeixis includens]|uniref:Uncharacterized protein n=1 Tax=Chrysodeixis includens TaxID=689277 RepID=A0A9N8Q2T2_CHRIL|nr:unnamed protein product [Chrysodeixis includens]